MAGTPHIVIRGLVLRETETKETDKILTLLTAEQGKISVIARGARRKNCKFAAAALRALALGFYMAELTECVTMPEEPAPELLRHLLNGLYALSALKKPPELVKPAFEIKLLCLAGYEPLADACEGCGRTDPEEPMLNAALGTLRCRRCTHGGVVSPLCRESLAALRHIVYGDAKRLYSFRLSPDALRRLSKAAALFLFAQLERDFKTLDFYESLGGVHRP